MRLESNENIVWVCSDDTPHNGCDDDDDDDTQFYNEFFELYHNTDELNSMNYTEFNVTFSSNNVDLAVAGDRNFTVSYFVIPTAHETKFLFDRKT